MGNIVHFEDLWQMSEKKNLGIQTISETEIIGKISSSVNELRDIYKVSLNSKDKQLVQGMKFKAIGRLLYNLTALSAKEDIDVYAALKDQLDIDKLKEIP